MRTSDHGVVTVTGGKLTTYRRMAQQTVDAAAKVLGRSGVGPPRPEPPQVIGAPERATDVAELARRPEARPTSECRADQLDAVVRRHGTETPALLDLASDRRTFSNPSSRDCRT